VAAWRKTTDVDPAVLETTPEPEPLLRNEPDPDPLIEEMVARLRDGLSSLVAVDEWGRPLAWRNVVRLALGPLAGRLRDTEQALELAVSMIPPTTGESLTEPTIEAVAHVLASETPVALPSTEDHAAEAPVHDPDAPTARAEVTAEVTAEIPAEVPSSQPTVDVILPASQAMSDHPVEMPETAEVTGHAILVEEPIEVEVEVEIEPEPQAPAGPPVIQVSAVPAGRPLSATSLFTVSGDQRPVAVSPLSPGQLLRGSGTDDPTAAKYDRFLAGLYGERKQVGGDEDRGAGGAGLGNDL
jgi:hypothetical protein